MNNSIRLTFKVVERAAGKYPYKSFAGAPPLGYRLLDKVTAPGDSLLLCFDDINRVIRFIGNCGANLSFWPILLCATEDTPEQISYLCSNSFSTTETFWKQELHKEDSINHYGINRFSAPPGTVGYKSLTPIQVIQHPFFGI
jgi:hypothetical protein